MSMRAYEREEERIEQAFANGDLTPEEYREELRELQRDYRAAAEEAAERAYSDEMERW